MTERMMKAALLKPEGDRYKVEFGEAPVPTVAAGQVLVRVRASGITHMEEGFLHGKSNARVEGLRKALGTDVLTGIEFSGVAESDGAQIRKGDEVFGYINPLEDRRGHAQYTAVPEGALAPKPKNVSHVEAASMVSSCLTVYEAMTQVAPVAADARVLVIGAAGGVGAHAVQFAQHLGAQVVAVARPQFADQIRQLGAAEVVSPGVRVPELAPGFDLIFDTAPAYTFRQCAPLLKDGGVYINTLPHLDTEAAEFGKTSSKKLGYLMVLSVRGDALKEVSRLIEQGAFRPVLDSVYPLLEVRAAHERFSVPGKLGKIVIEID